LQKNFIQKTTKYKRAAKIPRRTSYKKFFRCLRVPACSLELTLASFAARDQSLSDWVVFILALICFVAFSVWVY
jgi:hypothetical protein